MNYEKPMIDVLLLELADIVTLSTDIGDGENVEGDWS